jgi:phage tail protein X
MERYENYLFTHPSTLDEENKRRYYTTLIDPVIERSADDIYVICTFGDRLDLLASKYYSDSTLWWIISAANPELRKDSLYLEPGTQIRIPSSYQDVLSLYQSQNADR